MFAGLGSFGLVVTSLGLVLAGCEGDAPAVVDAPPADASDAGPDAGCGLAYAGEYVDWDSTAAAVLGIAGATWTVREQPTRTITTSLDGRVTLCVPDQNFTLLDVTPGTDHLLGIAFAKRDVLAAGAMPSARSMTAERRATFFAQVGVAYDGNLAQVLVHFNGTTPRKATITNTPGGQPQAWSADAWTAGDTGTYVFFPNVALGPAANTVVSSDAAGTIGSSTVPLSPGTFTYVELFVP